MQGTRIGPYEITDLLGKGGMGEVYRAHDTRLERDVALKMLPERVSSDSEFRRRFDREAKTISQLSHPHVCTLFDVGSQDGRDYLVMELLEGETLEERLKRGALPLETVVDVGSQIAEGVEAAHRKGLVHRDLKPGNVMLTPTGAKVLDFGLAKGFAAGNADGDTQTPTVTEALTSQGSIVGTLHYMSPEQLQGQEADARSDIFALGAVLYEMATGRRPYDGDSHAGLIASILTSQPPPVAEQEPSVPPRLGQVIERCLDKDPERRWQSARDLAIELRNALGSPGEPSASGPPAAAPTWRRWGGRLGVALVAALLGAVLATLAREAPPPVSPTTRLHVAVESPSFASFEISPDGGTLVSVGESHLMARRLDSLAATPIQDTRHSGVTVADLILFSPDSQWVAYRVEESLVKSSLSAGGRLPICECDASFGANWGPDDTIVLASAEGLQRVSASGGTAAPLTRPGAGLRHAAPHVLPGGAGVVFAVDDISSADERREPRLAVLSFETGEQSEVLEGNVASYAMGHLVFGRGDSLLAVPFDERRLRPTGEPFVIATGVQTHLFDRRPLFSLARDGTLVYAAADEDYYDPQTELMWIDRTGKQVPLGLEPASYYVLDLSPDGRTVALEITDDALRDVWLVDLEEGTATRRTFFPGIDSYPIWTPDGSRLVWARGDSRDRDLFWQAADGSGQPEALTDSLRDQLPYAITPDGETLLFTQLDTVTERHSLYALSLVGEPTPRLLWDGDVWSPQLSPDGRWLAFQSSAWGASEIVVRPFPDLAAGRWQVSPSGGQWPVWAADGTELFYRGPEGMMSVPVGGTDTFRHGAPKLLFERESRAYYAGPGRTYDVAPDGERFLMVTPVASPKLRPLVVVQNWLQESAGGRR